MTDTTSLVAEARQRIATRVYGNEEAVTLLLIALACRGHVLLEGMPGVGKTTLAKTFATVTGLSFNRVQLTPDLMPTDITGHSYYDQKAGEFKTRKGPVFTNVLLADEINRTPPRTQAALLEVMQEHQVTIEGDTIPVPEPFMVIATKNPIEVEGVYRLPEAELDRFMVQMRIGYPSREIEDALLAGKLRNGHMPEAITDLAERLHAATEAVEMHPDVRAYLLDIVTATREHDALDLGASPRASEQFQAAARAHAALEGRDYVVPDDVKAMAVAVLAHRLILTASAEVQEVQAEDVVREILGKVEPPIAEGPRA